jgi:hypothetical protein
MPDTAMIWASDIWPRERCTPLLRSSSMRERLASLDCNDA